MVDVLGKEPTRRRALARCQVEMTAKTVSTVATGDAVKGDVLAVARVAGIQAAKQTSRLIPLCHDLNLDIVDVQIELNANELAIRSRVSCRWATGVEMEALTAVSVAALTLYDMCKAVDKEMTIGEIRLVEKTKENPDQ